MWGRPRLTESQYESPSAGWRNHWSGFKARKFAQVTGPFPVIMNGRYAGFEKKQWFDPDRARSREFAVHYGYNPRCCFRGTYGKPGNGYPERYNRGVRDVSEAVFVTDDNLRSLL